LTHSLKLIKIENFYKLTKVKDCYNYVYGTNYVYYITNVYRM